jgi:hypothetical protein
MAQSDSIEVPTAHLMMAGGGGGGGYYDGFLGDLDNFGDYSNYSYFEFDGGYSGVSISTGDTVTVAANSKCTLHSPSGVDLAEGIFEIGGGAAAVALGITATLGSAGLFSVPGGGAIALGIASMEIGAAHLAPRCY